MRCKTPVSMLGDGGEVNPVWVQDPSDPNMVYRVAVYQDEL